MVLHRHITYQHEIDKHLKNFSSKILSKYNLPVYANNLSKKYQQSIRFKDINLYMVREGLDRCS